jgi:hypothetical protein
MSGLDPGIHHPSKSLTKRLDCRVKPGNDKIATSPSRPLMRKIPGAPSRDMLEAWRNWRYSMPSSPDLASLKLDDFIAHLEAVFEMQTSGGVVPLKLVEAVAAGGQSKRAGGAFSLVFVGSAGPWMPQTIYSIKHPTLGMLELFLVPIGPVSGGNGYQAIFA